MKTTHSHHKIHTPKTPQKSESRQKQIHTYIGGGAKADYGLRVGVAFGAGGSGSGRVVRSDSVGLARSVGSMDGMRFGMSWGDGTDA